jgi:RNA polymerase sigma-B factor
MHLHTAPSTDEQAAALVTAMAKLSATDPSGAALRDAAIVAWTPMAGRLARRYAGRGESLDDLTQVAVIGLIKAVDGFDPSLGTEFVGYAIPTILGELKRHFRDRTWSIRIPRRLQELSRAITRAREDLVQANGRQPTIADLAEHLDVDEEAVIEALESAHAYRATSLSRPVSAETGMELGDTLGTEEHGYDLAELPLVLGPAMACLTPRERRVITLRFYGNQTQTYIAEQIGVSQMHVSRLLTQALAKMRQQLGPDCR